MQRLKAFVLSRGETYTPENVNLSPHQETPSDTKAVFKQCPQLADSMLALALVFRRLYVPGLPGHRSDVVIWDFVVYIRVVMLRRPDWLLLLTRAAVKTTGFTLFMRV